MHLRKDQSLDELAQAGNVAQFVSFEPRPGGPEQAFLRILGCEPNERMPDPGQAIARLVERSSDRSVNVRSYAPESPRSREFVYGLTDPAEVMATVVRLTADGLHTIVNETIDVSDGGVSGVTEGGVIEFAPDDTPRCVEKPGIASLPLEMGLSLLQTVYGFRPDLGGASGRIEFSVHPRPSGWRNTHTLLWEREPSDAAATAGLAWPNRFSRLLGDKLYGLLMAHLAGMPVPRTTAFSRRVAPFTFGRDTGDRQTWIRTCPGEQQPGLFTTHKGWLDPFALMAVEDPDGTRIASVLGQSSVPARHAGASIVDVHGRTVVEGVAGEGDRFMLGRSAREVLPDHVVEEVVAASERLSETFGPVRTEWVHDGRTLWILQLHQGATGSSDRILVPGERDRWVGFDVSQGLEELRSLIGNMEGGTGIQLRGDVGMTSHIADLVRKAEIPTRVVAG